MIVESTAAPRRRRLSVPRLLRESAVFRSYWGAHTVSLFGDQVSLLVGREIAAEVVTAVAIPGEARVERESLLGVADRERRGAILGVLEERLERRHRSVVQVRA